MFRLIALLVKLSGLAVAAMAVVAAVIRFTRPSRGDATSDDIDLVSIWNGIEIESEARAFRGGSILTWWGGTNLDLRRAALDHDWAYLEIRTLFGGTSILVPEGWRVEVRGRAIAGGIESPSNEGLGPEAPLVDIDAFALFGGISVTRRPLD